MSKEVGRIIVLRHGDYSGEILSDYGKSQIESVSEKILSIVKDVDNDKVLVLSSPALRAKQSADILSEKINQDHYVHDFLFSDGKNYPNLYKVIDTLMPLLDYVHTLILVTHYEYTEDFPYFFSEKYFDGYCMPCNSIEKGSAWNLSWNGDTPSLELIRPFD